MKKGKICLMGSGILIGSFILVSCNEIRERKDNAAPPMQHEMHAPESTNDISVEFENDSIRQVYHHYLSLKNALVQTNTVKAKNAARDIVKVYNPPEEENEIVASAKSISNSNDINKQRKLFSELTRNLGPVLKVSISSGTIYKQYCPMVFEGKGGYWYSNSREIRNPYFGDKMLDCGRVSEIIE